MKEQDRRSQLLKKSKSDSLIKHTKHIKTKNKSNNHLTPQFKQNSLRDGFAALSQSEISDYSAEKTFNPLSRSKSMASSNLKKASTTRKNGNNNNQNNLNKIDEVMKTMYNNYMTTAGTP